MKCILISSIIGYILEIGIDTFSINNIFNISFLNSYSPFESSYFAGVSIGLVFYFNFYGKKNRIFQILSILFCLMTFKRLAIVFALLTLLIPIFTKTNKKIDSRISNLFPLLFVFLTLCYYCLLLPKGQLFIARTFGIDLRQLTMGRNEYILKLESTNWINYGIGSTANVIGKSIEMELIQFYIESGILGLIAFCFLYWQYSGNRVYSVVVMFFLFLNLLTSHSLTNSFNWGIYFIILYSISNNEKYGCVN